MFTEKRVTVDRLALNVSWGPKHGPRLVLLHGVGRRWQDFAPLLPALSGSWQLVGVDHRGHGRSDREAGRYLVSDYVADASSLLDQWEEPAILVGHSLGALTALGVAAQAPDRVRAVVLLDPPGAGFLARVHQTPYGAFWQAMRRWAGAAESVAQIAAQLAESPIPLPTGTVRLGDLRDPSAIRFMARSLKDVDPEVFAPVLAGEWFTGFDAPTASRQVTCPALLVASDVAVGGMLPPDDAAQVTAGLADVTRIHLSGIGHLAHWQDTAAVVQALLGFLHGL